MVTPAVAVRSAVEEVGPSDHLPKLLGMWIVGAGSIEDWVVHPRGAHPRRNGSQPEATGPGLHAQGSGSRLIERGGSPVSTPPLSHVSDSPRAFGSGACPMWAVMCDGLALAVLGCVRCCGVALLVRGRARLSHLSRSDTPGRSIRGDFLGRICSPDAQQATSQPSRRTPCHRTRLVTLATPRIGGSRLSHDERQHERSQQHERDQE